MIYWTAETYPKWYVAGAYFNPGGGGLPYETDGDARRLA